MCLLPNPITHVLGRHLEKKQTHAASFREPAPRDLCSRLGSKRKHSNLQHRQWEEDASTAAQGGGPARERPCGWRVSSHVRQRPWEKGKAVQARLQHTSTPQSMLGKKRSLWSRSPTKDLFIIACQLTTASWPLCRLKVLPPCRS